MLQVMRFEKAFREFALRYHPDTVLDATAEKLREAREHFAQGSEAYRILSGEESRLKYDRSIGLRGTSGVPTGEHRRPSITVPPPGGSGRVSFRAKPFYEAYEKCAAKGDITGAKLNLGLASKYDTSGFLKELMEEINEHQSSSG